ncbi:MAG TPA: hypothetical protein PKH05_10230 [Nitrospira sp.]|jgi:hypothetical protein|nr:hypothetical protein [Nitrospira sp.]HNL89437.1 hypothetical protein [Nitrospira sp.]HNN41554.1 hypothetical protein [Nitrospira sp.]
MQTDIPPDDDYANLPESIRAVYSRDEYLWLTDGQKTRLVQRETEPDWEDELQ